MTSRDEGRAERVKALLQQRRQSFGLIAKSYEDSTGAQGPNTTSSNTGSNSAVASKHERIQQLLIQRRMAQHSAPATAPPAGLDSSDGESVEGELLSPGSSMSSMGFEVDRAHAYSDPSVGSGLHASSKYSSLGSGFGRDRSGASDSGASSLLRPGGGLAASIALGMDTIEEEAPGFLQDSPLQRSPLQQRQRPQSPHKSCEGLVQQQLNPQALTHIPLDSLPAHEQPQQSQMPSSSGWQSGVGSLTLGPGRAVQEALASPYMDDEAISQGQPSWGMADNFSFGHQSASHSSPSFGEQGSGRAGQLQEGSSSSSSGGKRQRIETGLEGDSASVSSSRGAGGQGGLGGQQGGSSGSYTMSAGSAQGGSSSSAGVSSGATRDSGGGGATGGGGLAKKGPRAGDLRLLEERMAQAMHQISLGQDPGDGPFDISDLWAASSVQSASQSEAASAQHTLGSAAEEGGATSKQLHSPRAMSSTGTAPSSSLARAASPTLSTSTSDARQQLEQIQLQIRLHRQAMAAAGNARASWEEGSQGEAALPQPAASASTANWEGAQGPKQQQQQQQQDAHRGGGSASSRGQAPPATVHQPQGLHTWGGGEQGHRPSGSPSRQADPASSGTPAHWAAWPGSAAATSREPPPLQQQRQRQRPAIGRGSGVGGRGAGRGGGRGAASAGLSTHGDPQGGPPAAGWGAAAATATAAAPRQGDRGPGEQQQGPGQPKPGSLHSKLVGMGHTGGVQGPVEHLPGGQMGGPLKPVGPRDRATSRAAASATAFGRSLPKERPRSAPHVRRGSGNGCGSMVGAAPEYSFKPKMNEMSRQITDMSYPKDRDVRLMMLSMPKALQMQKYEQMRKQVEEQQLQECTFQPKLSSRPPSPHLVRPGSQELPVHDRLYHKKLAWEAKREKLLQERDMAQLEGCTFQPAINAGSRQRASSTGRAPLHKRVTEVLRTKNEHLSQARIEHEQEEAAANFKPAVNPQSLRLLAHRRQSSPCGSMEGLLPGERMYYEAMEAKQRGRPMDFEADAACTFTPVINDRSRALLATSGELPAAFLQRQQYLAALAAEKKAVYRSLVEGGDCTFTPRLHLGGGKSRGGSGSLNSDDWDDTSDRLTKLAYQDVRHSQAVKEALREHHYAQFTFAPEINPRSRTIGKHHTVDDLHSNEQGARSRARASQAVHSRHEQECTFKPSLDPHSLAIANQRRQMGAPSLLDRLDHDTGVKMRNARLQEAHAQREYEELKECTFTPEVNRGPPPKPEPSVSIPGLSRYAELQELAKRKKEEEQRRQEEVWHQRPKGSPHLFTVPEPFNLETEQREQRQTCYSAQHQAASSTSSQSQAKANAKKAKETMKVLSIQRILQQTEACDPEYED